MPLGPKKWRTKAASWREADESSKARSSLARTGKRAEECTHAERKLKP